VIQQFDSQQVKEIFLFQKMPRLASGPTHSPYLMGKGGFFSRIKQPKNAVEHLPRSTAKVKNVWNYTSSSPQISPWHGKRNLPSTSVQYKPLQ